MTKKRPKAKVKRRKIPSENLQVLKEQQKVLYLKQRRKARQRQLMFRRARALLRLGIILFMALFVVYLMLLPQWILNPLAFANYPGKSIVFKDNLITKDDQLIEQLRAFKIPAKPLYLINTDEYQNALKEIPSIKDVYVRRYWLPTRMIFTILEKEPALLIYNDADAFPSYALTYDGTILGKEFLPLPEIYKDQVYKLVLPSKTKPLDQEMVNKYYKIARIAEKTTHENLKYIDLRTPTDIKLLMSKSYIRLGSLDATVIERLSRLKVIMGPLENIQDQIEYIDLRWDRALAVKEKPKKEKKTQQQSSPAEVSLPEEHTE